MSEVAAASMYGLIAACRHRRSDRESRGTGRGLGILRCTEPAIPVKNYRLLQRWTWISGKCVLKILGKPLFVKGNVINVLRKCRKRNHMNSQLKLTEAEKRRRVKTEAKATVVNRQQFQV